MISGHGPTGTKKMTIMTQDAMVGKENPEWVLSDKLSEERKYITFGLAKAVANVTGAICCDLYGKKNVLIVGWIMGFIHVLMGMMAQDWVRRVSSGSAGLGKESFFWQCRSSTPRQK